MTSSPNGTRQAGTPTGNQTKARSRMKAGATTPGTQSATAKRPRPAKHPPRQAGTRPMAQTRVAEGTRETTAPLEAGSATATKIGQKTRGRIRAASSTGTTRPTWSPVKKRRANGMNLLLPALPIPVTAPMEPNITAPLGTTPLVKLNKKPRGRAPMGQQAPAKVGEAPMEHTVLDHHGAALPKHPAPTPSGREGPKRAHHQKQGSHKMAHGRSGLPMMKDGSTAEWKRNPHPYGVRKPLWGVGVEPESRGGSCEWGSRR